MGRTRQLGRPIGTFPGKAGHQDRRGNLNLAEGMVEFSLVGTETDEESGDDYLVFGVTADFPVNEIEVRWRLPEHAVERLIDTVESELD